MVKQNKNLTVNEKGLIKTLTTLKNDFEFPLGLTATHFPPKIEVIYKMMSLNHNFFATVKVEISDKNPVLPTSTTIFPGNKFHELEAYDLLGVKFDGIENNRILLPDEFEGHPLRKDYK